MNKARIIIFIVGLLLIIGGLYLFTKPVPAAQGAKQGNLKIEVLNIGQGDAILVQTREQNILIDTGDVYHKDISKGGTDKNIVELLKKRNISTIDKMIITHPHADHLGGAVAIMRNFTVKTIYDNGELASSKVYRDFLKEQKQSSNKAPVYEHLYAGDNTVLDFGDNVKFKVLSPTEAMVDKANKSKDKEYNNNSIVGQLTDGKFTMLFTGDAEKETENELVSKYGNSFKSTVLKVCHHGSNTSTSIPFLKAVDPKIAVISAGANSQYHHPHEATLKKLQEMHVEIYATNGNGKFKDGDNDNTIEILADSNGLISVNKIKE